MQRTSRRIKPEGLLRSSTHAVLINGFHSPVGGRAPPTVWRHLTVWRRVVSGDDASGVLLFSISEGVM